jgi:hypothetical protein
VCSSDLGRFTASKFREFLGEKLETINRTYRPYLHQLDIFFVKYTENLIKEYSRMLSSGQAVEAADEQTVRVAPEHRVAPELPDAPEMAAAQKRGDETGERPEVEADATIAAESGQDAAAAPEGAEEPVIAAMTEAAKEEDELPLETFLEMGTGTGSIDEAAGLEGRTGEQKTVQLDLPPAPEAVAAKAEDEAAFEPREAVEQPQDSFAPPLPAEGEMPMQQTSMEYPEETIQESRFSFAGRVESAPPVEVPPPPVQPQHFAPPPPPPRPAYTRDESVQPATIYDVEAETIIADRNEILKAPAPAAEPEQGKNNLGITGDDVSDMLDQFFGGPKKK